MIAVYGFGHDPDRNGVLMAMCPDDGFAADICGALSHKHHDQWFGYTNRNGKQFKEMVSRKTV